MRVTVRFMVTYLVVMVKGSGMHYVNQCPLKCTHDCVCVCVYTQALFPRQILKLCSMKMTGLRNQKANRQMGGQWNGSNQKPELMAQGLGVDCGTLGLECHTSFKRPAKLETLPLQFITERSLIRHGEMITLISTHWQSYQLLMQQLGVSAQWQENRKTSALGNTHQQTNKLEMSPAHMKISWG